MEDEPNLFEIPFTGLSEAVDATILNMQPPAVTLFNEGVAFQEMGLHDQARDAFAKALAIEPNFYDAHFNLAAALIGLGRIDDAVKELSSILAIFPEKADAWFQLGYCFELIANNALAAVCLEHASSLEPRNARARWDCCHNFLAMGDFTHGWAGMESRLAAQKYFDFRRPEPPPYWEGQPLSDKTVTIWMEQGIGEHFMLIRLVDEFINGSKAKKVFVECEGRLVEMFKRSLPKAHVYSSYENGDRYLAYTESDFQVPALHLARTLRPMFMDFPDYDEPIVKVDTERSEAMKAKYREMANGRPIIGLSWKSRRDQFSAKKGIAVGMGKNKSVPLEEFGAIINQDALFVSLQFEETPEELALFPQRLHRDMSFDKIVDIDVALAELSAMDAVISASNTVLHMAGALCVPTMAVLHSGKWLPWYWFLRRHDCPWYPSVRLFRPEPATDGGVWYRTSMQRINQEIAEACAKS